MAPTRIYVRAMQLLGVLLMLGPALKPPRVQVHLRVRAETLVQAWTRMARQQVLLLVYVHMERTRSLALPPAR